MWVLSILVETHLVLVMHIIWFKNIIKKILIWNGLSDHAFPYHVILWFFIANACQPSTLIPNSLTVYKNLFLKIFNHEFNKKKYS